ncbi:MAG: carbohydrate ABC transporter permease [Ruminiclostridium sp.]
MNKIARPTMAKQEAIAGYLFILPTLILLLIFIVIPIFVTLALSFSDYNLMKPADMVGLSNYLQVFHDPRMKFIFLNTFFFAFMAVIGNVGGGLLLAMVLNRKVPAFLNYIFRFSYFLPVIIGYVYVAIVWGCLYSTDTGIFNYYLGVLGIPKVGWLTNTHVVMFSIIIMDIWKNVGFFMIIFLAGLQNIPTQYYEAAQIDGANSISIFRHITIPLLSPTIFFNIIWCSVNALQVFDAVYILTQGGPGDSSRSLVVYIYENAFQKFNLGYASSISMVLFVVISILTFVQFRASKKWVHY